MHVPNANKFALPVAARDSCDLVQTKEIRRPSELPVQLVFARRLSYVRRTLRMGFQSLAIRKIRCGRAVIYSRLGYLVFVAQGLDHAANTSASMR